MLSKIALSPKLKVIDKEAFMHSGITCITIPSEVTKIGVRVFQSCKDLEKVVIEGENMKICAGAFLQCPNLKIVYIKEKLLESIYLKEYKIFPEDVVFEVI